MVEPGSSFERREFEAITPMRASPWTQVVGLASLAMSLTYIVGLLLPSSFAGGALRHLSAVLGFGTLGFVTLTAWLNLKLVAAGEPGRLRVASNGLYLDGRRLVARTEMQSAVVVPRGPQTFVRIGRGSRSAVILRVRDVAEGRAIIDGLQLGSSHVTAEFRILGISPREFGTRAAIAMAFLAVVFGVPFAIGPLFRAFPSAAFPTLMSLPLLVAIAMSILLRPGTATVGADGVLLRTLGRTLLVPLSSVVRAELFERKTPARLTIIGARFVLRTGAPLDVPLSTNWLPGRAALGRASAAELVERVNAATVAATETSTTRPEASVLARASRPIKEWVGALRSMASEELVSYRDGSRPLVDRLWTTLEDPYADAEERAACAVAIAPDLDNAGRARLRVVLGATAAPKLRVAFEAAVGDDDDKLVAALGEIVSSPPARRVVR